MTRPLAAAAAVSAAALIVAAATARAEGEQEAALVPYINAEGLLVGGGMTSGVLLPDGDKFSRVCEEAFDPAQLPPSFSLLRNDGTVLIGGHLGLFTSSDQGCSYDPVSGPLEARSIGGVTVVDDQIFLVTGDFGRNNGIWISVDGGEQWSPALDEQANVSLNRITANAEGTRIVASGIHTNNSTAAIFVSTDSGVTFTDVSAGYDDANGDQIADFPLLFALSFDSDDSSVLFGGLDANNAGVVVRASAPDYDTPEVLGEFPSSVTHIAVLNGTRYALAKLATKLFKEGDGETSFTDVTSDNTPTDCLFARADGTGLVGCGKKSAVGSVGVFTESSDGAAWTPKIGWGDIKYRKCPQGTIGATACSRFIEQSCNDGTDDDTDGFTDCDDDDCADSPLCGGAGEGEGEGEGDVGAEGEGEGEKPPPSCACGSVDEGAFCGVVLTGLVALTTFRRRQRPASRR